MAIGTPVGGTYTERAAEATSAVPYPATVAANDLLLLAGAANNATTLTTLPAGWTQIASTFAEAAGVPAVPSLFFAYKVAAGTEGGTSLTVTHANVVSAWQIIKVPGVDTTTPLDVAVVTFKGTTGGSSCVLPSLTTVTADSALVYAATISGTASTATPPGGFTELGDKGAGTRPFTMGYKLAQPVGATGTQTVAFSGTGNLLGFMVALRPLAAVVATGYKIQTATGLKDAVVRRWNGSAWIA